MTNKNNHTHKKLSIHIIGDAFVDFLCFPDTLPVFASDVRLQKPVTRRAGGSALNTTTHLQSLVHDFGGMNNGNLDGLHPTIQLHTCFNPSDEYGQILLHHAEQYQFKMINCFVQEDQKTSPSSLSTSSPYDSQLSTGHCLVITTQGDRSFLTYLGVLAQFKASDLNLNHFIPQNDHHHHHSHLHIAGYYNIQGFWNGALKTQLQWIRQQRHAHTMCSTTISLVPQADATNQYDGQLLDLLPLLDVLIMNEMETEHITGIALRKEQDHNHHHPRNLVDKSDTDIAQFFYRKNPQLYVIITLGSMGALVIQNGYVIDYRAPPLSFTNPIDPTGAGDAFVAGLLYGSIILNEGETVDSSSSIQTTTRNPPFFTRDKICHGLHWGCVLGTSCTMRQGASLPATKQELLDLMQ